MAQRTSLGSSRYRHRHGRRWNLEGVTYRDLAMIAPEVIERIPHKPVSGSVLPGYDGEKPVFVGHYWMSGEPAPLNEHVACLDYSVAKPLTNG